MARTACEVRTITTVVAADDDCVVLVVAFDGRCPRSFEQTDPTGEEVLLEHGGNLGVLGRQDLLARHDQGDLGAERGEHVHELDAGDT